MLKKRPWKALVPLFGVVAAPHVVLAANLGGGSHAVVLGQSLDFAVALRLDAGEALTPDCVSAEVTLGERRLLPAMVRVLVDGSAGESARVRVLTNQVVDEPVVSVLVNVTCGNRASRRYTVLADPAGGNAPAAVMPAYAAAVPEVPASLMATSSAAPAARRVDAAASADGAVVRDTSVQRVALQASGASGAGRAVLVARHAPPHSRAAPHAGGRAERRAEARAARRRAASGLAHADRVRRALAPAGRARLQLDVAAPVVAGAAAVDEALQAVAQAAQAARASASAASAAGDRIARLERTVEQLRGDARSSREQAAQWKEQLAKADAASVWTWPLAGLAAGLVLLTGWLALRLSAARHAQSQAWSTAARRARQAADDDVVDSELPADTLHAARAETALAKNPRPLPPRAAMSMPRTAPVPFVSSELEPPPPPARARLSPAWPPPAPSEFGRDAQPEPPAPAVRPSPAVAPAPQPLRMFSGLGGARAPDPTDSLSPTQATIALPQLQHLARAEAASSRDVSIEELLDLEQQAEFFVVLGQDDAAIDLLVEHLRHTGGGSPLPYLKLLEIYHRRGERESYERTRARFNHRFNAYAPEWDVGLQAGRSLADYAAVLARLQQVWSRPLDSMAELEALLFRKARGELFDLPAYREVLFLYSLARDLLDRESADTGLVDLLLPLGQGNDGPGQHQPQALLDTAAGHFDFGDRPTAPIDLDLTLDNERPTSIFDPLDERPQPPRRR